MKYLSSTRAKMTIKLSVFSQLLHTRTIFDSSFRIVL
nr:MAG TPA: hypothetical protein [Caudoviricetes sp.]